MAIDLRFRPIEKAIAAPKGGRQHAAPFVASWAKTLDDLERELKHLGAADIVVEADLFLHQIRNDGWPKGGASPMSPGIRIGFASKFGQLSYECATYSTMEANFRAIGLTLTALRLVERYGAVKGGEQYTGWKALPEGKPIAMAEWRSIDDAMRWLSGIGEGPILSTLPEDLDAVYKQAAKKAHPDITRDNGALMAKANRARDYIESVLAGGITAE